MILLDPPYAKEKLKADLTAMEEGGLLATDAIIMIESDQVADLPEPGPNLNLLKQKDYGITRVSLYRYEPQQEK